MIRMGPLLGFVLMHLLFTLGYTAGGFDLVYVDGVHGFNRTACGSISFPCKTLYLGLQEVKSNGRILISGKQNLFKPLRVSKNISVLSWGKDSAVITSFGKHIIAFVMQKHELIFNITNIQFNRISIILVSPLSKVSIRNCTSFQAQGPAITLMYPQGVSLYIMNSTFLNSKYRVIVNERRNNNSTMKMKDLISIHNTRFQNVGGIFVANQNILHLVLMNVHFLRTRCPIYVAYFGVEKRRGTVQVKMCKFVQCHCPGPIILVQNYEIFSAVGSYFVSNNNKGKYKYLTSIGGAIELFLVNYSIIISCRFYRNIAHGGGAICMQNVLRSLIKLSDFNSNSDLAIGGSAIYIKNSVLSKIILCVFSNNTGIVNKNSFIPPMGSISIIKVYRLLILKCNFTRNGFISYKNVTQNSGAIYLLDVFNSSIRFSQFISNRGSASSAIFITNTIHSEIGSCTFQQNEGTRTDGYGYGSVLIVNVTFSTVTACSFDGNLAYQGSAISTNDVHYSLVEYSNFTNNVGFKHNTTVTPTILNRTFRNLNFSYILFLTNSTELSIISCAFLNNSNYGATVMLGFIKRLRILSSVFSENKFMGSLSLINTKSAEILDCLFSRSLTSANGGAIVLSDTNNSNIKHSTFINNKAQYKGGAIYFDENSLNSLFILSSTFEKNSATFGGAIYVGSYSSSRDESNYLITKESLFLSNEAGLGGALYNADILEITNTTFKNDIATELGKCIYNIGALALKNVSIKSRTILHLNSIIHSQVDQLKIEGVKIQTMFDRQFRGKSISLIFITSHNISHIEKLHAICPRNYDIKMERTATVRSTLYGSTKQTSMSLLILKCNSCIKGSYTLDFGFAYWKSLSDNISIHHVPCIECPIGGICNGDIIAKDNFWGYKDRWKRIHFIPCPVGNCCNKMSVPCTSYNTCEKGRGGILCGTCNENYSLSFITNQCISKGTTKCNYPVFMIYFITYAFLYTIFWLYITFVLKWLKRVVIASFNKGFQTLKRLLMKKQGEDSLLNEDDEDTFSTSGFLKIITSFYQMVPLIHLTIPKYDNNNDNIINQLTHSISKAFNFRIIVYQEICPVERLDRVTKEFLSFALKLSTFISLFILLYCSRFIKYLRKRRLRNPNRQLLTELKITSRTVEHITEEDVMIDDDARINSIPVFDDALSHRDSASRDFLIPPSPFSENYEISTVIGNEMYAHDYPNECVPCPSSDPPLTQQRFEGLPTLPDISILNYIQTITTLTLDSNSLPESEYGDIAFCVGNNTSCAQYVENKLNRRDIEGNISSIEDTSSATSEQTDLIEENVASNNVLSYDENKEDIEDEEVKEDKKDIEDKEDFETMIRICFTKLLKISYTPVLVFALQMTHCVVIRDTSQLYIQGDITCYNSWQYAIFVVMFPWMLLFPLTADRSFQLLKSGQVTTNLYLIMLTCPYIAIVMAIRTKIFGQKHGCHSERESRFLRAFIEGEEGAYRGDSGMFSWQVVLLLRSLLISVLRTYIIDPLFTLLLLLPSFIFFHAHDRQSMPYLSSRLNLLQCITTIALSMVTICNILPAIIYTNNIRISNLHFAYEVASKIEVVILVGLLPFWYVVWTISKCVRKSKRKME